MALPAASAVPVRRRKRGRIVLVSFLIVVVLLVVAVIVGDGLARSAATRYARDKIATALHLPSSRSVHVDLGGGIFLLQALSGRIDEVHVNVDSFTLNSLTGSASAVVRGVPLDSSKPVTALLLTVDVPEASLRSALTKTGAAKGANLALTKGKVDVSATLPFLGATIPLRVGLTPSTSRGQIVFTPNTVTVNGKTFSTMQVKNLVPAGLLGSLLLPQSTCVADKLPKSFVLRSAVAEPNRLVLTVRGDGAVLGGNALITKGRC